MSSTNSGIKVFYDYKLLFNGENISHFAYLSSMTFPFMSMNKNILSIKNASNHNDQHCPHHSPDKGKIVPEM